MIDLQTYKDYFRNIADKHKRIAGFLKLSTKDMGEATTTVRNGNFKHGDNILLLENFEIKQHATNNDQIYDIATGLFCVFQYYDARGKYDLDAITDETLTICKQIEARIRADKCQNKFFAPELVKGSFEFEPCHATILNMFGWRVFFDFSDYSITEYNPNNWED